jgi:hypothetical protein
LPFSTFNASLDASAPRRPRSAGSRCSHPWPGRCR